MKQITMAENSVITINVDGASRGNPGPSATGVIAWDSKGNEIFSYGRYLGSKFTNNVAEYSALLDALQTCARHGYTHLNVFSDSQLMVRQINGRYKVKNPAIRVLFDKARSAIVKLESFSIHHVPRCDNIDADRLANEALDQVAGGT